MTIDPDALPMKQRLILEILTARHRLGERHWPIPEGTRKHLNALQDAGLIWWESGPVEGWLRASLTEQGKKACGITDAKPEVVP